MIKHKIKELKIALVHDILTQLGGAERVLLAFTQIWKNTTIYTPVYDKKTTRGFFNKLRVKTSFIQKLPFAKKSYKWYLLLFPSAFRSFDLRKYQVVLSDSASFAKGVFVRKPIVHICYLHTPTRYLTMNKESYLRAAPIPFFIRPILPPFMWLLRKWDYHIAQQVDYYIANSENVAKRLKKFYHREADLVLFPPVETKRFKIRKSVPKEKFFLVVSRIEPYKKVDLAVKAFNKLGIKLKIAGTGTKFSEMKKIAGKNVELLGWQTDEQIAELYSQCEALIFPQEEDAGITPLECMASGRPVIAFGKGGALETVVPGKTGEFFNRQTVSSLVQAIKSFRGKKYSPKEIRKHAYKLDISKFKSIIEKFIESKLINEQKTRA